MPAEQLEFKAELKELLHLITHSLYSDRDIFLRELISNASDAINKVKFDSLQNADKLEGNTDWKIKITPDQAAGTLTISDNGVGIPEEQAESIFQIFASTKGSRGTGLGLPVSKKIIMEHGGKISLKSKPGEGSTFEVELPIRRVEGVRSSSDEYEAVD